MIIVGHCRATKGRQAVPAATIFAASGILGRPKEEQRQARHGTVSEPITVARPVKLFSDRRIDSKRVKEKIDETLMYRTCRRYARSNVHVRR